MEKKNKVKINVSQDKIEAKYSDFAIVGKNALGFNIDFAQRMPGAKQVNIVSRIAMSPQHAKLLSEVLRHHVQKYEDEFGEIQIPKKAKPVILIIVPAIPKLVITIMGDNALGIMCLNIILKSFAPKALSASINSCALRLKTVLLTIRLVPPHPNKPRIVTTTI